MKYSSRLFAAFAVSTSLSMTEVQRAYAVEPMTIAAAASLGSALLNASTKPSSVSLQIAMAQLDISRAIHGRLDHIENSLASILTSLANMPDEMRRVAEEDRNINRSEEMLAIMDRLYSQLRVAEKEWRNPARDPLIVDNFNELQNTRARLFLRSDLVTPTIIHAFAVEVTVAKALNKSKANMEEIYSQYAERLDKIVSGKPGSLQAIYDELSAQHRTHEANMFQTFLAGHASTTSTFETGYYPWLYHSLQKTVQKSRQVTCDEPALDSTKINYTPFDVIDKSWEKLPVIFVRSTLSTCDEPYSENDPVHNSERERQVTVYPSPIVPGLYKLKIDLPDRITREDATKSWYTTHLESDDDYEKPHMDAHNTFMVEVKKFNTRMEILEQYKMTLDLAKITRALVKQGADANPEFLQQKILAMNEGVLENESLLDRITGKANANLLIMRMEAERAATRETIDRAYQKINKAIEDGKKDQWKQNVMMGLNILSASMQFAEAMKTEMALSQMRAAADAANEVAAFANDNASQNEIVKENGADNAKTPGLSLAELNAYAEKLLAMKPAPGEDGVDKVLLNDAFFGLKVLEQMEPGLQTKYYAEKAESFLDLAGTKGIDIGEAILNKSLMPLLPGLLEDALASTSTATDTQMNYFAANAIREKLERVVIRGIEGAIPDRSLLDDLKRLHPDDINNPCYSGPCLEPGPR